MMSSFGLSLVLVLGQMATTGTTVRLTPDKAVIPLASNGKVVELLDCPANITLPALPMAKGGRQPGWSVEIKNLGPRPVTIRNGDQVVVRLLPNEGAKIALLGESTYVRVR